MGWQGRGSGVGADMCSEYAQAVYGLCACQGARREWLVAFKAGARKGQGVKCTELCPVLRALTHERVGSMAEKADLSNLRAVLTFSASASAMPPSGPRLLLPRLRKR